MLFVDSLKSYKILINILLNCLIYCFYILHIVIHILTGPTTITTIYVYLIFIYKEEIKGGLSIENRS